LQRLEAVEEEEAAPLADEAGEALALLERAGAAGGEGLVRGVAEEGEGFLEEQVGGSGQLLARALAVEGPHKGGVAARPVLPRQFRRPFGHEGGFSFAAEGGEGEEVGTGRRMPDTRCRMANAGPGVVEELGFRFAADELGGGVFEDAGEVGLEFGGDDWKIRSDRPGFEWLDLARQRSSQIHHFTQRGLGDEWLPG